MNLEGKLIQADALHTTQAFFAGASSMDLGFIRNIDGNQVVKLPGERMQIIAIIRRSTSSEHVNEFRPDLVGGRI